MKKFVYVDCGTYPFHLLVFVGMTNKEMAKKAESFTGMVLTGEEKSHLDQHARGRALYFPRIRLSIIIMRDFKTDYEWLSVLAHEIVHAVHSIFDEIKLRISDGSEEAFTYQVEYLTRGVLKKLLADDGGKDVESERKRTKNTKGRK